MALTALQETLLSMLAWFHEYCQKHGLRYYLVGGAALGAARHHGFIPWDDDIDVDMPRPDYERLKELCKEGQGERYRFEFYGEKKEFIYPFGKLYDTQTTLIENVRYKPKRGIGIDIFPTDGLGDTYEESLAHFKKIDKKANLLSTRTCAWRKGRKLYKNLAVVLMRLVPEFILSTKKIRADIDRMSKEKDFDSSVYVANCVGNWHEKEILKREWLGTPTECTFEGLTVFGPEKMDEFLTGVYGDWRTPPPPEKQVTHHDYIRLDLQESYLQEEKEAR